MTLQELFDNRKAELQAARDKIDAEIAALEVEAQTFGAWLEKEAIAAKNAILDFFNKHGV